MFNIALIATLVLLVILTFYKGRGLMYSLIIAFYPTALIFNSLSPYKQKMIFIKDTAFHIYLSNALIFFVIFAIVFLVARGLGHYDGSRGGIGGFVDALLLSSSIILLVMTTTFHILPATNIYNLTADLRAFFISDLGYSVCVFSPIVVLLMMTRRV